MSTQAIQHVRANKSDWELYDPILSNGELGYEVDTYKLKIGDGSTSWNNLSYLNYLTYRNNTLLSVEMIGNVSQSSNIYNSYLIGNISKSSVSTNVNNCVALGDNIKFQADNVSNILAIGNKLNYGTGSYEYIDSITIGSNINVTGAVPYGLGRTVKNVYAIGDEIFVNSSKVVAIGGSINNVKINSVILGINVSNAYYNTIAIGTDMSNISGIAIGTNVTSMSTEYAISIGSDTVANTSSIAIGYESKSVGVNSISLGMYSNANSDNSLSFGYMAIVNGIGSIGIGYRNYIEGSNSISIGTNRTDTSSLPVINGNESIAIGHNVRVISNGSTVIGLGLTSNSDYQTVLGKYNEIDSESKYAYIFGYGNSDNDRKNIYTIDINGIAYYSGKVQINSSVSITNNNDLTTKLYVDTINTTLSGDISNVNSNVNNLSNNVINVNSNINTINNNIVGITSNINTMSNDIVNINNSISILNNAITNISIDLIDSGTVASVFGVGA